MLVGGLGAGGKSIYALDVSAPDTFSAGNVLWEYADAADLGNTYSQPQIARLHDGSWAAVFGNGYNAASDKAFLYVSGSATARSLRRFPPEPPPATACPRRRCTMPMAIKSPITCMSATCRAIFGNSIFLRPAPPPGGSPTAAIRCLRQETPAARYSPLPINHPRRPPQRRTARLFRNRPLLNQQRSGQSRGAELLRHLGQ